MTNIKFHKSEIHTLNYSNNDFGFPRRFSVQRGGTDMDGKSNVHSDGTGMENRTQARDRGAYPMSSFQDDDRAEDVDVGWQQ